jgi:putative DNA primase/helicase
MFDMVPNLNLDELLSDGKVPIESLIAIQHKAVPDDDSEIQELHENSFYEDDKGNLKLNDGVFARLYMMVNKIVFANGAFYSPDGMQSVGLVQNEVLESISGRMTTNIASNTKKVVDALKITAFRDNFDFADKMLIPFANGDMELDGTKSWVFTLDGKQPVPYRLPVNFIPLNQPRKTTYFNKWLNDLFTPEDIVTLQEYIGYCLLPTTRGQKCLLLIGDGGIGKSVISDILTSIFGRSLTAPNDTQQFLADKFKLAELENQLVFYEDDLSDKHLEETGVFKKLITNQTYLTADRKNEQPFKFKPYCRFIMCGNDMLASKYDKTDGFYRRLLPIRVKPKDPNRKNIPDMGARVAREAEGIIQWALVGLKRLMDNNWQFTVSERSDKYLNGYKAMSDHFPDFVEDVFEFGEGKDFSTTELQIAYKTWCKRNAATPCSDRVVTRWFANNSEKYHLESTNNVYRDGARSRGYAGAGILSEYTSTSGVIIGLK